MVKKTSVTPVLEPLVMLVWTDSYGINRYWSRMGWSDIYAQRLNRVDAERLFAEWKPTWPNMRIEPFVKPPIRSTAPR